jgi:hypothetical protein
MDEIEKNELLLYILLPHLLLSRLVRDRGLSSLLKHSLPNFAAPESFIGFFLEGALPAAFKSAGDPKWFRKERSSKYRG